MKTTAGVLALAAVAAAQSIPACAVNCFTEVITDHPPLECKEADMYHCFCKDPFGPDLQRYFLACARSKCGSTEAANNAIQFGVDLCSEIGFPITIPVGQATSPATTSAAAATTKAAETTSQAAAQSTTKAAEPSASASASKSASTAAQTQATSSSKAAGQSSSAATATSSGGAKPTGTDVVVPTKSAAGTGSASSPSAAPSTVVISMAGSVSVSSFLAAAGVAVAVFRLL